MKTLEATVCWFADAHLHRWTARGADEAALQADIERIAQERGAERYWIEDRKEVPAT